MTKIAATEVSYIKLGSGGEWETECIRDGTIRFGYRETPHTSCVDGDWASVQRLWMELRGDAGTATRDTNQIRTFYEADEGAIFITFSGGLLYWCRPSGPVKLLADNLRIRATLDGWHSVTMGGKTLTMDRLSGNLLKVQRFQGTICKVRAADYLLRKLNDDQTGEVAKAEEAERQLRDAIVGLMRLLTWKDFELLVDLVFSSSGWRRVSPLGGTQKTVDLELLLPTTGERAFVQVKSQATANDLRDYTERFIGADTYDRMFFVWHSGNIPGDILDRVTLVGPERLSGMVLDAGLSSWLREKVS